MIRTFGVFPLLSDKGRGVLGWWKVTGVGTFGRPAPCQGVVLINYTIIGWLGEWGHEGEMETDR